MPRLIKDTAVIEDQWTIAASADEAVNAANANESVYMSVDVLENVIDSLPVSASIGVILEPGQEPSQILQYLDQLQLIAINFPVFTDGRGFSYARELRQTHDFRGEIRATGDVMRDQFHYLMRAGFDAFQPEGDTDLEQAVQSLKDFSDGYQASIEQPQPLFRRR